MHIYNVGVSAYRARLFSSSPAEMEVTFIRHAESLGNLLGKRPWQYALEAGSSAPYAWKDGGLSESGRKHSRNRVMNDFDDRLVDRILKADVVFVSPLIRAMETCIIVLSTAARRQGITRALFDKKRFVVTSDLREKLSSDSDKPGASGIDVEDYLKTIAREQAALHRGSNSGDYDTLAQKIIDSYSGERDRSRSFSDDPDDADKLLGALHRFRTVLDATTEKHVLIIGHNGWSRWNFAAGLQGLCTISPWSDVAFGGRQVGELKNVGVLTAKYARQKFHDVRIFGTNSTCAKKGKFGVFTSINEAKDALLIPGDTVLHHMLVSKKMDLWGYKVRWITLSASGGHSFLAWSNGMAEPRKYIDLVRASQTAGSLRYACDQKYRAVLISVSDSDVPVWSEQSSTNTTVKPFHMQPRKRTDMAGFNQLCLMFRIHIKFGSDARFIADRFRELGWDNGAKEPSRQQQENGEGESHRMAKWERMWQNTHPDIPIIAEVSGRDELEKLRHDTGIQVIPDINPEIALLSPSADNWTLRATTPYHLGAFQ